MFKMNKKTKKEPRIDLSFSKEQLVFEKKGEEREESVFLKSTLKTATN